MSKKKELSRTRSIYISDSAWEKLEAAAKKAGHRSVSPAIETWVQGSSQKELEQIVKP